MPAISPDVVCLTPAEVFDPVYRQVAATMPPHVLVPAAGADAVALRQALTAATVIIGDWTGGIELTAADIAAAGACVAIVQPTAGYNCVDIGAAGRAGIPVANAPGANASAVAEWVVMAALMLLREVPRFDREVRAGSWPMVEAGRAGVLELRGRTIGIIGLGAVGIGVASRVAPFQPGAVLYVDVREAPPDITESLGLDRVSLPELMRRGDVVSVHVPLSASTRRLVSAGLLDLMGPASVLINTSRGGVVDSSALLAALRQRRIKGAALDVFDVEPLRAGHPWDLDNVLLSPHLSGSTNESRDRMIGSCLQDVARVLRGEPPRHIVNGISGLRRPASP
jgi:D-3-phosphoglycerate dehydrogenase / 2-oxoglutarate reductase